MAREGELVKMGNGRWARFQRCTVCNAGHQDSDEVSILVAVELDERDQELLAAAESSTEQGRQRDAVAGSSPALEVGAGYH